VSARGGRDDTGPKSLYPGCSARVSLGMLQWPRNLGGDVYDATVLKGGVICLQESEGGRGGSWLKLR
jgi:hypothetical protein